jgi:hypothetical protein
MDALIGLALSFLAVQLLTLLSNLLTFPVLRLASGALPPNAPKVSILVPARNEVHNLPETLPRLLAQPVDELMVLDDHSTDGTAELVAELAKAEPRLKLLRGQALPSGWSGKNWACQQLAEAAGGQILIFTDADVFWEPGALQALLAFQARERADFVSVWPRQLTSTLAERLAVPLVDLILLSWLPYLGVKYLPSGGFAAGNGQLMFWTRPAYQHVGGHTAVKSQVLEDVRMGQRAKALGLKVALALGGKLISTRMYRSDAEVIEGFSKNILAAHGGSRLLLAFSTALNTLAYTAAWPLALLDPAWLWVAALGPLQRALVALKTQREPWEALLQPLLAWPLWRIVVRTLRQGGGYVWKGRVYRGGT